jgi:hypothetical protein
MLFRKLDCIISTLLITGFIGLNGENLNEDGSSAVCADVFVGYTLFAPNNSKTTYLIDVDKNIVHRWSHNRSGGYAVYLLENGHILRTAQASNGYINGGGSQGYVQEVDWDGNLVWEFLYSSSTYLAHHDIEPMPNGNVLIIAWEVKSATEAKAAGRRSSSAVWPDHVIEVEKSSSNIVWEWHTWDHLVQDYDATKANYGVVANHPELIDANLGSSSGGPGGGGDWQHINGISYNPTLDQIVISSHNMSEIYVIDHSTTTAEAKGHTGGKYGKGGDILYRWGKPANYDATGSQYFSVIHCPSWIPYDYPNGGDILIFNNGTDQRASSIVEITTPVTADGNYTFTPGSGYGPASPTWTYSNGSSFYSSNEGCCQRLPNGNTLITDPDNGYLFEVNQAGQKVWEYKYNSQIARSLRYAPDYDGLSRLVTPVELSNFSAQQTAQGVRIVWATRSESSNYGFALERTFDTTDVQNWSEIFFIRGNETSATEKSYGYLDEDMTPGRRAYRLRQIDLDGSDTLSEVLTISISGPTEYDLEQNYPNPFNPTTTIRFSLPKMTAVTLTLYNALGEKVAVLVEKQIFNAGTHSIHFTASLKSSAIGNDTSVSAGIYFYRLLTDEFVQVKKMVLLR